MLLLPLEEVRRGWERQVVPGLNHLRSLMMSDPCPEGGVPMTFRSDLPVGRRRGSLHDPRLRILLIKLDQADLAPRILVRIYLSRLGIIV